MSFDTASDVAPQRQQLEALLSMCVAMGASDLHISANRAPYGRLHGQLAPVENAPAISVPELETVARQLIPVDMDSLLDKTGSVDGNTCTAPNFRLQCNQSRRERHRPRHG